MLKRRRYALKKKSLKKIGFAIIGIALLAFAGSKLLTTDSTTDMLQPYRTVILENQDITSSIRAKGNVEAKDKATLISDISGRVKEVHFKEGDTVEKGDILLTLDSEDLQKRIRDAKLQVDIAEATLKSQLDKTSQEFAVKSAQLQYDNALKALTDTMKLFESGLVSAKERDAVKLSHDQALQALEQATQALNTVQNTDVQQLHIQSARNAYQDLLEQEKKYTITATMSGTLSQFQVKENDVLTAGATVALIETFDQLVIRAFVPEYDVPKLSVGNPVVISGYGVGESTYSGSLDSIALAAASSQGVSNERSVAIIVAINEASAFKPNFSADMVITYREEKDILAVPYEALIQVNDTYFVYKLVDGEPVQVPVEIGIQNDVSIQIITSELSAGDDIVLNPEQGE